MNNKIKLNIVSYLIIVVLSYPIQTLAQTTQNVRKKSTTTTKKTTLTNPIPQRNVKSPKLNIELVKIPAGEFMMGSNDYDEEKPVHRVRIDYTFYMGKYEVTQAQWQMVMGENPSHFGGCTKCPVERVSWNDAKEFIKRLNAMKDNFVYRLPSEAEWEYACRAGTKTAFAFGDSLSSSQANFDGTFPYGGATKGEFKAKTMPVGSYKPNAFGLYDMHGNVWEWCEDVYADNYEGLPADGSAWSMGDESWRVLRGGSWIFGGVTLRSASRLKFEANELGSIGFRVVAVPETK